VKYIVITAQAVGGSTAPARIEHYWDGRVFSERQEAVSHGFKTRGSDDFNIGMVNKAGSLHSIWWMDEDLHEPPETLRAISQEIGLHPRIAGGAS
jgi:hypothetical protein